MSDKSFIRHDTSRRGGFTLLEVAIALAIFVFGALAIIRIFPPALGIIQNSGDQLTAVNFNRSMLARFARQPELVPDAIHDYSDLDSNPTTPLAPNPNWRDSIVGSVAGTPRRNNSLPLGTIQNVDLEYNQSALGHFKNIAGERHIVRTNPAAATEAVILTQFPMEATAPLVAYTEDILSDVTVSDTGVVNMTNAKFSDGTPYVAPPSTSGITDKFYVSYRWVEGDRVWGVEDEPQETLPTTVDNASRGPVVAGEVNVRLQRPLATSNRDNNRGSFRVNVVTPTTPSAFFGQRATVGQKISIDYRVKDWRWMVYDGVPTIQPENATATQRAINLPVRNLDDTLTPFVYTWFPSRSLAANPEDSTSLGDQLNRKTGQILFDLGTTPPTAPTARVTYRTLDNWAQQVSVAAQSYLLTYGTPSTEPWRDCVLVGNILYFKPSEAGKSVLVTYSYDDPIAGNTQIDGRILTINDDIIGDPGGLPTNFAVGGRVSRLELTDINGERLTTPVTSIQKIQGVSVEARTAWLDGNRFSQASTTGYRGTPNQ